MISCIGTEVVFLKQQVDDVYTVFNGDLWFSISEIRVAYEE